MLPIAPVTTPRTFAVLFLAIQPLVGCSSAFREADTRTLAPPTVTIVEAAREDELPPPLSPGDLVEVYTTLVDPRLGPLLTEALRANPDVAIAIASIEESRAIALQARAARYPTIAATAVAGLSHNITAGIGSFDARSLTFSLPVSYEVDLAGRYAREHRAAQRDAMAVEADSRTASMSVAAEVADAFLELVSVRVERTLLEQQREANARMLEIVGSRERAGLASSVDRMQQQQVALGVETLFASLDDRESRASLRLALLLGREPGARFPDAPTEFVVPDATDRTEITAVDLSARPDVEAAILRLEAADDRVAAAVRSQMPQLRLTASPGYSMVHSSSPARGSSTAQGFTWAVQGSLTVPIFDGLRARSIVQQRRAEIVRRLAELDRVLRLAVVEASASLASENQARRMLEAYDAQYRLAVELREDAEASYVRGLVPYVNVLLAVLDEQAAARSMLDARKSVVAARITWVRAIAP